MSVLISEPAKLLISEPAKLLISEPAKLLISEPAKLLKQTSEPSTPSNPCSGFNVTKDIVVSEVVDPVGHCPDPVICPPNEFKALIDHNSSESQTMSNILHIPGTGSLPSVLKPDIKTSQFEVKTSPLFEIKTNLKSDDKEFKNYVQPLVKISSNIKVSYSLRPHPASFIVFDDGELIVLNSMFWNEEDVISTHEVYLKILKEDGLAALVEFSRMKFMEDQKFILAYYEGVLDGYSDGYRDGYNFALDNLNSGKPTTSTLTPHLKKHNESLVLDSFNNLETPNADVSGVRHASKDKSDRDDHKHKSDRDDHKHKPGKYEGKEQGKLSITDEDMEKICKKELGYNSTDIEYWRKYNNTPTHFLESWKCAFLGNDLVTLKSPQTISGLAHYLLSDSRVVQSARLVTGSVYNVKVDEGISGACLYVCVDERKAKQLVKKIRKCIVSGKFSIDSDEYQKFKF